MAKQVENPANKVETPSCQWTDMHDKYTWDMIDALSGGTLAMRTAQETFLPRMPKEGEDAYACRLDSSFLYEGFEDTCDKLGGKPFTQPVTVKNIPAKLEPMLEDVDRNNRDITQFSKELFKAGIKWGLTHVVIDYPKLEPRATLADEIAAGARPVFVHVTAKQLIGWRSVTMENGAEKLTMIRYKECKVEANGDYGDIEVDRIRVLTENTWEIWTKQMTTLKGVKVEKYVKTDEGVHTFGRVPIVSLFLGERTGFMTAKPPLLKLAWKNLEHWQSSSDQRSILRIARCAILFGRGFTDEEVEKGIVVGPNSATLTTNPTAELMYVEHTGAAIKSGEDDLAVLQAQMETLGLQPLLEKTGDATATGRAMDAGETHSAMQTWVMSLVNTLKSAFEAAAEWVGETLPDDFGIDVYKEFTLSLRSTDDLQILTKARTSGEIDRKTYLDELKRRGVLAESADVQVIMDTIETEGPPLGLIHTTETALPGGADGAKPAPAPAKPTKPAAPPAAKP